MIMKYELVSKRLWSLTESKTRSNACRSCFAAPACCISPLGDANLISSPSQNFLADNFDVLQILCILPLSPASAVA